MKIYGYVRVSAKDQNLQDLEKCRIEKKDIFPNKISGKNLDGLNIPNW